MTNTVVIVTTAFNTTSVVGFRPSKGLWYEGVGISGVGVGDEGVGVKG